MNYVTEVVFCKVCSDEATGIHYGVETCEACKVFFRRFLNKYTKYSCTYTNTIYNNVNNDPNNIYICSHMFDNSSYLFNGFKFKY